MRAFCFAGRETNVYFRVRPVLPGLSFSGDADAAWLEKQLDKLLEFAQSADIGQNAESSDTETQARPDERTSKRGTLSGFLRSHNATSNQVRKFLATAVWLTLDGKKRLTTGDVTKALSINYQGKLSNASDCLNRNVKAGRCEKEGNQFYVTEDGFQDIGVPAP